MANMSYCRFQNTQMDFQDCVNAIGESIDYDEPLNLSADEQRAFDEMVQTAQDFLELVEQLEQAKETAE